MYAFNLKMSPEPLARALPLDPTEQTLPIARARRARHGRQRYHHTTGYLMPSSGIDSHRSSQL